MNKALLLFFLAATTSAFSQGQVVFNNKSGVVNLDAPIYYGGGPVPAGTRPDPTVDIVYNGTYHFGGINAMAGLYYGVPGTPENALTLLGPVVSFRSGVAAGYVANNVSRTLPDVPVGAPAIFQIRAWDTGTSRAASYEDAVSQIHAQGVGFYGAGNIISISALGGAPYAPSMLIGAEAFGMPSLSIQWVPEPGPIALGLLGAIAGILVFQSSRRAGGVRPAPPLLVREVQAQLRAPLRGR